MKAEELKGHLDALILATLAREPLHGYAVIEALKARSDGALTLPEGTVYPALHRLEADGLLASEWSTTTGRRRRVYSITRRGEKELGVSRTRWRAFSQTIEAVLATPATDRTQTTKAPPATDRSQTTKAPPATDRTQTTKAPPATDRTQTTKTVLA